MDPKRRNFLVYGLLFAVWALILSWQLADRSRTRNQARADLYARAKDVSSAVGSTMRVLRRFGGVVSQERLETTLTALLRPGEWEGISLLNEAGQVVASAGMPIPPEPKGSPRPAELWTNGVVILLNPVALGTNVASDLEPTNVSVIIDFPRRPAETNRPPPGPPPRMAGSETNGPPDEHARDDGPGPRRDRDRGPGRPPRFTRPPWWTDEEWKALQEQRGVHSFAVVMSTKNLREASARDLWLRCIIVFFASISAIGVAVAWRNLAKTSDLQLRLVRTSELNIHLKEMNLAAAGLAHETRNPLNIIRGLAHMISRQPDAAPETRARSREIVDETDKVTAQLNEFINYSRPREVRRSALALNTIVGEVTRALSHDIEEKKIRVETKGERLLIEADEQLFRQVLFNLVLNATQAVGENGEIQILTQRTSASGAILEVRDNGPGVPPERRAEIFKPYFTTNAKGTGLGLAIVHQNVLAHGWEIQVLPNEPKGAIFRISHLKVART